MCPNPDPKGKTFTYDDHGDSGWVLLWQSGLFQKRHGCSLGQSRHWGGMIEMWREVQTFLSPSIWHSTISRGPFLLLSPHWFHVSGSDYLNRFKPACCLLCLPMLLLSHVSLDPVSIHRHQLTPTDTDTDTERGKKLLFILLLCFHTQPWTLPVCLGLHTRGNTPPQHNVPPAFLFAVPPTSIHPLSYHTWPAARLASVNPGAASQTKGSSNQIYVGLGLLWNVAVEHV